MLLSPSDPRSGHTVRIQTVRGICATANGLEPFQRRRGVDGPKTPPKERHCLLHLLSGLLLALVYMEPGSARTDCGTKRYAQTDRLIHDGESVLEGLVACLTLHCQRLYGIPNMAFSSYRKNCAPIQSMQTHNNTPRTASTALPAENGLGWEYH